MYTILVYDTATERNAAVLRTCRKYLHHIQNSVFEGELSKAQLIHLQHELQHHTDPTYDDILVYTLPPGAVPHRHAWGTTNDKTSDII
ncbi:CRISPR-associated endonuclease Cas2 [Saccharopolyspora gregorii]|uniref:CRISPR-associated endoribonuclease Cas2 n=1 Tax=Saccharopolyspora gregorii TaxID=33914 RepID=A0ABP6RRW9_9PSEU